MARVEMELERFEDAVRHVDEALNIFIGLGLDLDAAQGFVTLGLVHHRAGDVAMAEVAYRQALRSSRLCGSTFEEARSLRQLGLLAAEAGAFAEARARWLAALDLYRALGSSKADDIEADLAELPVVDGAGPA
jgi:tetratricopeptide (TPR) repeat protein